MMNKRIKELAKKAGFQSYITTHEEDVAMFEKFAELIVKECATAITDDVWAEGCESWAKGMRYSAEVIKIHFGVEE